MREATNLTEKIKVNSWEFPGDPVVQDLPSSVGDADSILVTELKSTCHGTTKPKHAHVTTRVHVLCSPHATTRNKATHHNEEPVCYN